MPKPGWAIVAGCSVAFGCAAPDDIESSAAPTVIRDGARVTARGDLGTATDVSAALRRVGAVDDSLELRATSTTVDGLGQRHVRFHQRVHALPVVAGDIVVHVDDATDAIIGLSGIEALPDQHPADARIDGDTAIAAAVRELGLAAPAVGEIALTYVATETAETRLTWAAPVSYVSAAGPERDIVFASAIDGALVTRHPKIHRALDRRVYTANNQQVLPGALVIQEGNASADASAQAAYDNAGAVYEYYLAKHGRDSFDNGGAQLRATVHFGQNYANAFWNGQQMAYGDGDGDRLGNTALSFDIVAHELTHAVTQHTANLIYRNESGALNEAWSDILAASADAHRRGAITPEVWALAEDVWTPATPGDALRYMDDPTRDGVSSDYYPERFVGADDNGGVHLNSGIANLAFALLVKGGSHPRGKTPYSVPAVAIADAERIFYRALAVHMTPTTNFAGARLATAQAATELLGSDAANAVHYAWDAVGVPGTPERAPVALSIASPANGADVSAGFAVTTVVAEGDDSDIAQVELLANGSLVGTAAAPPYQFETDATVGLGQVAFELKTYDRSGQEQSTTSNVNVVPATTDDGDGTNDTPDQGPDSEPDPGPGPGSDPGNPTSPLVGGCQSAPSGSGGGGLVTLAMALAVALRRRARVLRVPNLPNARARSALARLRLRRMTQAG